MTSATPSRDAARAPLIDATWTVNEVLVRFPETVVAFNAFGVDACCGGAASLAEAAREAEVPLDDLIAGVASVIREGR